VSIGVVVSIGVGVVPMGVCVVSIFSKFHQVIFCMGFTAQKSEETALQISLCFSDLLCSANAVR
jgi:hypothetical protein